MAVMTQLRGSVAVVTGASRGIGRGIALGLGEAGATVYVTGRTVEDDGAAWPGSISGTASEVTRLGGHGIGVRCDHRSDVEVEAIFQRIRAEQGRLDLLVNNATSFGDSATGYPPEDVPFWELPIELWDQMHVVGLRSHYVASRFAVPLLIETGGGLIVSVSSAGAAQYVFGVAYGAAKAAVDKLTADMAHELRPHKVAVVSVWPRFTRTEKYQALLGADELSRASSPLFTGRAVAALAVDPKVMDKTGRALPIADLAEEYGFIDTES
jgi:dehydrogenase/reductase SDR family protein 1